MCFSRGAKSGCSKDDVLLQSDLQDSLNSHREVIARRQEYLRTLRAQLDPSFVLQEVCGDGACMFRAFSFSYAEVSGIHHDVTLVRHKCVENIRDNPQLAARFADQSAADSYLNQMSLPYTYGDEVCLHSLALIFNIKIALVTPDYGTLLCNENGGNTVRLAYNGHDHYDVI